MSAWEYFSSGSWCMWLIALCGMLLYTLLIERAFALYSLRKTISEFDLDPLTLHLMRSKFFLLIRALIAAIPLLGLLGTVTGMMDSFSAMRSLHMDIGAGIGQALVTTQYALLLAAPALLIERLLNSLIERDERRERLQLLQSVTHDAAGSV